MYIYIISCMVIQLLFSKWWGHTSVFHKWLKWQPSMLLIFLVFSVVLLCVFTFPATCCDVRYDFRINTMFGLSLPPVVCRRAHVLFTLSVFIYVEWCPTHIVLCFCFVCLRFVCCVASFSGLFMFDCPFCIC